MEKRFKKLKQISEAESTSYVSALEDFKNNFIHFYTQTPSVDPMYPSSEGWDEIKYFTNRTKRNIPSDGNGKEVIYIMSNISLPGMVKIGYTGKEVEIRREALSKPSGVPTPFKIEYIYRFNGGGIAFEGEIHKYLKDFRLNNGREFFEIGIRQAKEAIKKIGENYI